MQKSASAWIGSSPLAARHRDAAAAQNASEGQLAHAFGQRHHRGHSHRGRPADEDVHAQRLLQFQRGRMMHADAAMDLVVHARLAFRRVAIAAKLHAVHAQVRAQHRAGVVRIFSIDLRQRDVSAAVVGPRFQLRKLVERGRAGQHRPGPHPPRQGVPGGQRRRHIAHRPPQQFGRIDLQPHQPGDRFQRVAKQIPYRAASCRRGCSAWESGNSSGR